MKFCVQFIRSASQNIAAYKSLLNVRKQLYHIWFLAGCCLWLLIAFISVVRKGLGLDFNIDHCYIHIFSSHFSHLAVCKLCS
jgi:hypothetical protein